MLKLATLRHPQVKRRVARYFIKYGAYLMVLDACFRIVAIFVSVEFIHHLHSVTSVLGVQGAALAGVGGWIDVATEATHG